VVLLIYAPLVRFGVHSEYALVGPEAGTTVNVPSAVKVWIVQMPEVVTVPPVEAGETPSLPSVR
jgi:hypothetical protein